MKGIIRLCYKLTIDAASEDAWAKLVWIDTWMEFKMQAQQFDQQHKCQLFTEILTRNPKADQMHYLVSTAATGYIRQLKGIIPNVVNTSGNLFLEFKNFRFEIIQSHISDVAQHKIAICFYSNPVVWLESFQDCILISREASFKEIQQGKETNVETVQLLPPLTIATFKNESERSVTIETVKFPIQNLN